MQNWIQVDFGKPLEISLKYTTPLAVKSRTGTPLAMFTCTDGRKLYVPPVAGHEIAKLNLKVGERFKLLKTKANSGAAVWNASRLNGQPVAQLIANAGDLESVDGRDTPVPCQAQNTPPTKLEDALKTAVAAACAAEKYGREIGYAVRFAPSDIKSMGISVLIAQQQGSRYAA